MGLDLVLALVLVFFPLFSGSQPFCQVTPTTRVTPKSCSLIASVLMGQSDVRDDDDDDRECGLVIMSRADKSHQPQR